MKVIVATGTRRAEHQTGSATAAGADMGEIAARGDEDSGEAAAVSFPFDRMTVQRFREAFPRARWSDGHKAWIVPGKTARRRIDRWIAREESRTDPHADAKGRDTHAFERILSSYLSVDERGFRIKTPYSRKLVELIRQIAHARWDGGSKIWHVPFASYDELAREWEAIEAEARRSEPDERRKRAQARSGTEDEMRFRRRAAERKRRRIPLLLEDLPPLHRPIATALYGIIVVRETTGELVEPGELADLYPDLAGEHIWGTWRKPSLEELVKTRPSRAEPKVNECAGGWWLPTLDELREARRTARSRERRVAAQPSA